MKCYLWIHVLKKLFFFIKSKQFIAKGEIQNCWNFMFEGT